MIFEKKQNFVACDLCIVLDLVGKIGTREAAKHGFVYILDLEIKREIPGRSIYEALVHASGSLRDAML